MRPSLAPEAAVLAWIAELAATRLVLFPQEAPDGGLRFLPVSPGAALVFEGYRPTVLPPGKAFSPGREVLFTWRRLPDGGFHAEPVIDDCERVLAGVRPCDLKGITLMDRVNREGEPDPHYLARREAAAIIAYACRTPCGERCFCQATGSLDHREGADVLLTPVGGAVLVEAQTELGEALVSSLDAAACDDPGAARREYLESRPSPFGRQLPGTPAELSDVLSRTWQSPVWERHSTACFGCGTCNLVCPTCYCFDTHDEVDLAAPTCGHRCRTWDGCMLSEFASVADGHDFRKGVAARQRHRVKRKFQYLPGQHGEPFCTGCGRCGTQCTVDIDIFSIARDLLGDP